MSATWTNPTDRTQGDLISASDWNNLIGEDGSLDYANFRRGRKNYIINGNFDIWQRGTSVTGGYGADRWTFDLSGATGTFAQGTFTVGQTDVPNNPKFYGNVTITGADNNARIEQKIEDVNTLAGETITISFWAKYTSNAPTSFNIAGAQDFGSGGSSIVNFTFATGQTLA
jgi:hypothetical protein